MEIPNYCSFYKFLLVEEILLPFPIKFHFGKCSTIGSLGLENTNRIYLANITTPEIQKQYQLLPGQLKLPLLWTCEETTPIYNETVELFGETVFRSRAHGDTEMENKLPRNTKDFINEINELELSGQSKSGFWSTVSQKYEAALKVHSCRFVTQATKLVECNLKLRMCQKLRDYHEK